MARLKRQMGRMENMERLFGLGAFKSRLGRWAEMVLILAGIVILGVMVGLASSIGSLHMRMLEFTLLLLSMLMALYLCLNRPHMLISYTLLLWVISPEIRRLLDWSFQSYTDLSIIILIPYCVSLVMIMPVAKHIKRLDPKISLVLKILCAALAYGFCLGFLKYGFSSVYDLLNYTVPFLVMIYVIVTPFSSEVRDRWLKWFSFLAVIVGAYGIYQYLALPPWDEFWMISSEMNSIGQPEPQKFRLFSLLNSPGPAGVFLAAALALMTVQRKWRAFGMVGILIVAFALLLTLVRVGWIAYVIMIAAYFLRSQLKSKLQLLLLGALIVMAYQLLLPLLPGAGEVSSRIETFGSLDEDHSFNERLVFSTHIMSMVMGNPVGMGLGSSGLGAKLAQSDNVVKVFDNGYLNLFYTFGLPFGLALISVVIFLFIHGFKASKSEKKFSPISFAGSSALLFLLLGSNVLLGFSGFILLWITALGFIPKPEIQDGG
ncbi:hypothetical protein CHH75_12430 [Paenibacillus sp. 7541]|nr:hypothetical protein CHH75_12430 [Paenibacillus sp. 7541]